MEATILHADLDAFYASVEQRDDPRLRGRPVIVGMGVVLAASYEAKACGVRTAMGGGRARRLCPHAVAVKPRMSAYSEASKAVFEIFEQTTPAVEGLSIDEAFLDVRGMRRIAGTPLVMAVRVRARASRRRTRGIWCSARCGRCERPARLGDPSRHDDAARRAAVAAGRGGSFSPPFRLAVACYPKPNEESAQVLEELLHPVDTSSPRETILSFLRLTQR
jgi:nucleotidyltransferase/DNA polymerase involved in DNA repair